MADVGSLSASISQLTTTSGLGPYTLGMPIRDRLPINAAYTSGETFRYQVTDESGTQEVSEGVFTAPDTLTRATFVVSSTGSFIDWPSTGQRIVTPIVRFPICDTVPTIGQVLAWNGIEWCPITITSVVPPPAIVCPTPPLNGQVLIWSAAENAYCPADFCTLVAACSSPPSTPLVFDQWYATQNYVDPSGVTGTVINSRTLDITTIASNEIIVLQICLQAEHPPTPSVITVSGGGLTWHLRTALGGNTGDGNPGEQPDYWGDHEVWWALAPSPGTVTVTVTVSSALAWITLVGGGVIGANTLAPWDVNGSLPAHAFNFDAPKSTTQVSGVSTTAANTAPLFFYMDVAGVLSISTSSGQPFVKLASATIVNAFIGLGIDAYVFGYVAAAPLVSETFTGEVQFPSLPGQQSGWILIGDALRAG